MKTVIRIQELKECKPGEQPRIKNTQKKTITKYREKRQEMTVEVGSTKQRTVAY